MGSKELFHPELVSHVRSDISGLYDHYCFNMLALYLLQVDPHYKGMKWGWWEYQTIISNTASNVHTYQTAIFGWSDCLSIY